jgi:hypothetical protein
MCLLSVPSCLALVTVITDSHHHSQPIHSTLTTHRSPPSLPCTPPKPHSTSHSLSLTLTLYHSRLLLREEASLAVTRCKLPSNACPTRLPITSYDSSTRRPTDFHPLPHASGPAVSKVLEPLPLVTHHATYSSHVLCSRQLRTHSRPGYPSRSHAEQTTGRWHWSHHQ